MHTKSDDQQLRLPGSTVERARVPMALPLDRWPVRKSELSMANGFKITERKTEEGKQEKVLISVTARLWGIHQLILDVLFATQPLIEPQEGGMIVVTELYALLRLLGHEHPGKNDVKWLLERFDELFNASIITPDDSGEYREIRLVIERRYTRARTQGHCQYMLHFSPQYMDMVQQEMPLYFTRAEVLALVPLPALVRGVVRFMRSHKGGAFYRIETVLRKILPREAMEDAPIRTQQRRVKSIRDYAEALGQFGIVLDGEVLRRTKQH